ncbi:SGNH/GDSL hydrolase family protein [Dysgonomonas sp. Marseille-P4361]|uniref:SGNH/GDSL hydrolase family protein n=1 Tax=Dysgonomonas sp. Marseille-P4361 TaxID=2161820 RepID=UPI000D560D93|nr:SGNH/GDSL hydrolase family protein [Dysgonomonas sp. Marseille-P4361]
MQPKIKYLLTILLIANLSLQAQLSYHSADSFPLLGKISKETETLYERLPQGLKGVSREAVWYLGKNSAGLAVRFSTDATTIGVKWKVKDGIHMNHMTDIGSRGLDLYCLEGDKWIFVNAARPTIGSLLTETTIISNMTRKQREYMLYLPLYDALTELEIGVNEGAIIEQPKVKLPNTQKPIVAYGTSILQGGCASRPGMAHTNILSRWLNTEIINLGFSGNAQLDYEIAELIGSFDSPLYILDFMPNVETDQVNEKLEKFYNRIRSKAPTTTILIIENPIFPKARYDTYIRKQIESKNEALNKIYNRLKEKDPNIFLISSHNIIGNDMEATVDGLHFTDLGFMRYAEYLLPIIQTHLKIK